MTYSLVSPAPTLLLYLGRGRGREHRPLTELLYLQSEANYTWLVWADGKRILTARSLCFYVDRLPADAFVRLHRQYIVNLKTVAHLERGEAGGVACLTTGEQLPISRRQWRVVRSLWVETSQETALHSPSTSQLVPV